MARANRRCCPHANAEPHRDADQNDGPHYGRLGGAAQIAEPGERLAIGNAAEAEVWLRLARRRRLPDGGDEPHAILDAGCGAVAEILDRCDDRLDESGEVI